MGFLTPKEARERLGGEKPAGMLPSDSPPPFRQSPADLEPLIRRVVQETLAQLGREHGAPATGPTGSEPASTGAVLLTARQAARALAISERKLWELTKQGQIPHVRVGRAVRYRPADLDAWAEARKQSGM
jgi:excisionase family DNA binding protein